jgi:hypothetical protein
VVSLSSHDFIGALQKYQAGNVLELGVIVGEMGSNITGRHRPEHRVTKSMEKHISV